jgi:hypothetical protein
MSAIRTGWRQFQDPESETRDLTREQRADVYRTAWFYYRNRMFSRGIDWSYLLAQKELYKLTRPIYNPVTRIVDFYVDNIWQNPRNEDFESLATPVSEKADEVLLSAIAQLDQWGNFLSEQQKIKRYAAATGNVLIELVDDLEREKVTHKTVWASFVTDIQLNLSGDVTAYTLEYSIYDRDLQRDYTFRKEVTKESFSYFRDDKPFVPEGKTAEVETNIYGFCPAVWIRHTDDGGDFGIPACQSFDKVDDLFEMAALLHDNIGKEINSGKVLGMEEPDSIKVITGGTMNKDGSMNPIDPRLDRVILATKGAVSMADLSGQLKLNEARPYLENLLKSFDDDYPELQAASIIRENSQLSGAALERMLTPAQNRLDGAQAGYNQQLIKLRQMQLAVAGMRSRSDWKSRTPQQDLFRNFDLTSYGRGDLDFQLKRSTLVQMDESEAETVLMQKAQRATEVKDLVDELERLKIAGYSEDEAMEIMTRRETERQRNMQEQMQLMETRQPVLPPGVQPRQLGAGEGAN